MKLFISIGVSVFVMLGVMTSAQAQEPPIRELRETPHQFYPGLTCDDDAVIAGVDHCMDIINNVERLGLPYKLCGCTETERGTHVHPDGVLIRRIVR
jgi:hypothetical protein